MDAATTEAAKDVPRAMETADPRVLQASNYPMQPWLDVAEGGWATVVAVNNRHRLHVAADDVPGIVEELRR